MNNLAYSLTVSNQLRKQLVDVMLNGHEPTTSSPVEFFCDDMETATKNLHKFVKRDALGLAADIKLRKLEGRDLNFNDYWSSWQNYGINPVHTKPMRDELKVNSSAEMLASLLDYFDTVMKVQAKVNDKRPFNPYRTLSPYVRTRVNDHLNRINFYVDNAIRLIASKLQRSTKKYLASVINYSSIFAKENKANLVKSINTKKLRKVLPEYHYKKLSPFTKPAELAK